MSTQNSMSEDNAKKVDNQTILSDAEKDALGEVGNICMGTCSTTLSTLLGKRVTITTPNVIVCQPEEFLNEFEKPIVVAEISYTHGAEGKNIFILKKEDALLITDLLMGNDGSSSKEELSEYYLSATSEVMNQMVGSAATALADIMRTHINISSPKVNEVSKEDNYKGVDFINEVLIRTSFRMEIEGLLVSNIMNLMSFDFGKKLAEVLINGGNEKTNEDVPQQNQSEDRMPPDPIANKKDKQHTEDKSRVALKAVKYQSFDSKDEADLQKTGLVSQNNIDIIMEVPLQVTVVLGRSKKSIKEILELGAGSVVVLERFAGEMVDVLVNGKMIARGEVVVVDDNYGVRITEIMETGYIADSDNKAGGGQMSRII